MNKPVRLAKQDTQSYSFFNSILNKAEAWVLSHALLCLIIFCIILMTLFITLAFILVGVSATGDTIYNGMEAVI